MANTRAEGQYVLCDRTFKRESDVSSVVASREGLGGSGEAIGGTFGDEVHGARVCRPAEVSALWTPQDLDPLEIIDARSKASAGRSAVDKNASARVAARHDAARPQDLL